MIAWGLATLVPDKNVRRNHDRAFALSRNETRLLSLTSVLPVNSGTSEAKRPPEGGFRDRYRLKLNLLAEHIADPVLDRVFPHQLELRIRLKLPHRDFREGNCDGPVAPNARCKVPIHKSTYLSRRPARLV
jgi:hypothetical protein